MRDPYQIVDGIDEMKIRTREDFTKILELYKDPVGIIIGGGRGLFIEYLMERTMENLFLYVVKGVPRPEGNPKLEDLKRRLTRFGDRTSIITKSNKDASDLFKDGFFDFIYIDDGSSHEAVAANLEIWWPKVKDGGMISGQGYAGKKKNKFTAQAVNEFISRNNQELFFTYEESKENKDRLRSYYFFKNMAP
ncbi:MAG: class I SAM-dependent methyltransferase [Candidatus Cloacimonetes bacterium]|jgi:hypothetical protein|nr:class I SAM-dependent methyltransferase [Candidatus Cloacimonadota bacterium]